MDTLMREARAGDPTALSAMDDVARWLGVGLSGLVNLFNPERIVLGGRFGRLFPFVADTVRAQLDRYALPAPRRLVDVVPADLGRTRLCWAPPSSRWSLSCRIQRRSSRSAIIHTPRWRRHSREIVH
jgi:predicted NBD/HSP70 family sugar kinase